MKVYAFANQKGGCGKTTTTAHFGVNLSHRGYKVVFLDVDPHAALTEWWESRTDAQPQLLSCSLDQLPLALNKLRQEGVDFVLIDTPGFYHDEIDGLLKQADLVVIPSKASPLDLRATRNTVSVVNGCERPMVFVLNEVRSGTRIEGEAVAALSQHGRVAPVIHYKNDFVTSMIQGFTIAEISPQNPGAYEINALTEYLLGQVGEEVVKPLPAELATPVNERALKRTLKQKPTHKLTVVGK